MIPAFLSVLVAQRIFTGADCAAWKVFRTITNPAFAQLLAPLHQVRRVQGKTIQASGRKTISRSF
jgi:hypothetical protein